MGVEIKKNFISVENNATGLVLEFEKWIVFDYLALVELV